MRLLTGFSFFYVFFKRHGADLLFKGSETSIECSAEEDLTFKVISNKSNKSFTIGECDLKIKTCHIFETPLENKISLSSTGRGGLMRINSLDEETVGTYICCETYNPNKCLSSIIVWPFQVLVNNSENRPVQPIYISANNSGETSTDIAQYIGLSIGAAIGINMAICLCAFLILKRLRYRVFERMNGDNNGQFEEIPLVEQNRTERVMTTSLLTTDVSQDETSTCPLPLPEQVYQDLCQQADVNSTQNVGNVRNQESKEVDENTHYLQTDEDYESMPCSVNDQEFESLFSLDPEDISVEDYGAYMQIVARAEAAVLSEAAYQIQISAADSEYYSNHDYEETEDKRYDPYDDDDKTISSYEADEERHDDTLGEDIKETHETQFLEHVRQLHKEIREELQNIDFLEQWNRMRMELPEQTEKTTPNRKTQMINDEGKDETQAANGEAIAMARAVCKRIKESLFEAFVLTIH